VANRCKVPFHLTATPITRTHAKRLTFALQLRQAIDGQDVSVRELARRLNPENPEAPRSGLHKWLKGKHVPSRSSRRTVAVALGLPADHFLDDDDTEED
jgi:hypothetical protein